MEKGPGPSPSLMRLAAITLTLFTGLILACNTAYAQISPGPLAKAHQSLNGATQCTSCHEFGTKEPTFKCLECHKEIAQSLSSNHGYHALLKMQNPNGRDCVRCHLEHNGVDFALVHWVPSEKQFDHKLTGYPLVDKHASVACEKCHTPSHMVPAVRSLIKKKDLATSFMGLSPECVSCHQDPHKGQLGPNCTQCHNIIDWKQASQFDHSKTRYPLTGLHAKVECVKCHFPTGPDKTVKYKGIKFDSCTDCHTDPH
ncbi:MAG: cytochrome c3 family protein, partial [Candidatus Acidiferrales bacterium]